MEKLPESKTQVSQPYRSATQTSNQEALQKERELHQSRWGEESKKIGVVKRIIGGDSKPMDFAHEEALRENREFETRQSALFKESLKQLSVVVDNLKNKRDALASEGKNIKPLLLILSGGLTGPYATAQTMALKRMGFGKIFSQVVGISTGAAVGGYFLANNPELGETIYDEDLVKPEFFDPKRIYKMVDVGFAIKTMGSGPKTLDTKAILDNPTEFWVQAVNDRSGEPELINAKTVKQGILEAIHASMALPFLYNQKVKVNEGEYIDGGLDPLPLEKIIAQFKPTDILILPNMAFTDVDTFKPSAGEQVLRKLLSFLPQKGTVALAEKVIKRKEKFHQALNKTRRIQGVNIGILWPPNEGLTMTGQDSDKMKAAFAATQRDAFEKFGEEHEIVFV